MGNLFDCFKATNTNPRPEVPDNKKKSRVNETDKAILDVKARLRKLKTYIDKLQLDTEKQQTKIQEHLKEKNKQRALLALKQRKFIEKELDKAMGA